MTTLSRWNPGTEIKNLQQQLNRLMLEPFARVTAPDEDLVSGTWVPPVDVVETQDKIIVRAELPGMKQEDVNIEFENGILTLRGERKFQKETSEHTYHRVERAYGNFIRSFTLPRTVDPEKISASYRDGLLEIEVPKKEDAKPRQIKIGIR
jgi:HSP20 family protein